MQSPYQLRMCLNQANLEDDDFYEDLDGEDYDDEDFDEDDAEGEPEDEGASDSYLQG